MLHDLFYVDFKKFAMGAIGSLGKLGVVALDREGYLILHAVLIFDPLNFWFAWKRWPSREMALYYILRLGFLELRIMKVHHQFEWLRRKNATDCKA